ncbi:MAG TPA: hypothetical protein VN258_07725 [Mobilitalea sp.]|nr:hypothetical protein [Mobilitalea sp.]
MELHIERMESVIAPGILGAISNAWHNFCTGFAEGWKNAIFA